jgi:protoporphyrinogen oxidase
MSRILIIGAGPTGIGAALHLMQAGENDFLMLEAGDEVGGLASSDVDAQGFTWDLGGHVQFSHYKIFDDYMELALGKDGWFQHERESWVWMRDRFIPYPFQNNLHRLPPEERWQCVRGLYDVSRATSGAPEHFRNWILATFGTGVAESFLFPYNFKVWAHPLEQMSAQWVGERVAVPAFDKVLEGICREQDQLAWGPNSTFRFPRRGGTGAIWRALGDRIPSEKIRLRSIVRAVDTEAHTVTTEDGARWPYDTLISTMPLDRLLASASLPDLATRGATLLHSNTNIVGIGLEGQPPEHLRTKCWMYFPESNCPFYRVTVFSNYSAENTPRPGKTWSLMAEVSQSIHKPVDRATLVADVIAGLKATRLIADSDSIVSRWSRSVEYGYPVPSRDRDRVLNEALPFLDDRNIHSRGRFGAWKYEVSNQDHSFMQGWECISRVLSGDIEAERTLRHPHRVNAQYNA